MIAWVWVMYLQALHAWVCMQCLLGNLPYRPYASEGGISEAVQANNICLNVLDVKMYIQVDGLQCVSE